MADEVEDIMDAFEASAALAGVPHETLYGADYEDEKIYETLAAQGVQRLVVPDTEQTDSDIELESGGQIFRVPCEFVFMLDASGDNSSKDAVRGMRAWLAALGFVTENGSIGFPPNTPVDFQGIRFTAMELVGGRNLQAQKFGGLWLVSQLVTFDLCKLTP